MEVSVYHFQRNISVCINTRFFILSLDPNFLAVRVGELSRVCAKDVWPLSGIYARVQSPPFIDTPSATVLLQKQLKSVGISRYSCGAEDSDIRNAAYFG